MDSTTTIKAQIYDKIVQIKEINQRMNEFNDKIKKINDEIIQMEEAIKQINIKK